MNASNTKSGTSATRPGMNMTWKRALKLEKIARLTALGMSNIDIANHLNCHVQTIVVIRNTPQYHAKQLEVASGVVSEYDKAVREDTDNAREELQSMIPSAMMVIRNSLLSKNPNIALKAAQEVFDREGSLAKVSKSSVSVTVPPALELKPEITASLMALLGAAPASNPANDISAATGTFTVSAADSARQAEKLSITNSVKSLDILDLQPTDKTKLN